MHEMISIRVLRVFATHRPQTGASPSARKGRTTGSAQWMHRSINPRGFFLPVMRRGALVLGVLLANDHALLLLLRQRALGRLFRIHALSHEVGHPRR